MSDLAFVWLPFGLGCALGVVATIIYWPWIEPKYFEKEPKP